MTVTEISQAPTIRDKLKAISVEEEDLVLNLLAYGESGIGKTYLCGTAADLEEFCPVLIIDCEGGTTTIRKKKNIDVKRVKTLKDIEDIHNDLFMHNKGWYKTVCLDSLSEIQDVDMRHIMKETKQTAKNPDNIDVDVPSPREYGKSRVHIRVIVRAFRDLPMHTIITALDQEVKEEGKPTRIRPNLPGKLQSEIPGFMNVVGYFHWKGGGQTRTRMLQIAGTTKVIAKTRFPELGELIENPTIPDIWNKIDKEGTNVSAS